MPNHQSIRLPFPPPLKDLETYVHKVMKQWQVPGLAIAVVKNGKVVLAKGYGVRELGKPGKVDANTLFDIGSVTKQFTAGAQAKLAAKRKYGACVPLPLKAYTGTYHDDFDGTTNVSLNQGHLVLRFANPDFTGDLEYWHDNTFRVTWRYKFYASEYGHSWVTFNIGPYGKPVAMKFARIRLHYDRVDSTEN